MESPERAELRRITAMGSMILNFLTIKWNLIVSAVCSCGVCLCTWAGASDRAPSSEFQFSPRCGFMDPDTRFKCLQSQAINIVLATSKLNNEALKRPDVICRHKRALATTLAVNHKPVLLLLTLSSIRLLTGFVNLSVRRHSYDARFLCISIVLALIWTLRRWNEIASLFTCW